MKNAGKAFASITPEMAVVIGVAGTATVAVAAFAAAMIGLSGASYKMLFDSRAAGIEFEAMRARLEGLTGSASRAQEMLGFGCQRSWAFHVYNSTTRRSDGKPCCLWSEC